MLVNYYFTFGLNFVFITLTYVFQNIFQYNENDRFDNYYNNYNVDWRNPGKGTYYCFTRFRMPGAECGVTVDGKSPILANRPLKECIRWGCPRGFKPTMMKMRPPPLCDPCGVWCAEVQECPPKRPKVSISLTCRKIYSNYKIFFLVSS